MNHRINFDCYGYSLIENLLALVLISIASTGLIQSQIINQKINKNALHKTIAILLVNELQVAVNTGPTVKSALSDWQSKLSSLLPNGTGSAKIKNQRSVEQFQVKLSWGRQSFQAISEPCPANQTGGCYQLSFPRYRQQGFY